MSVQVSYKKQALFFIIIILIATVSLDQLLRFTITSYENQRCVDRMINSEVYKMKTKDEIGNLCTDYENVQSIMTKDGVHVYYLPNQKSEHVNINSIGLRGNEILEKDEQYRIIVVGGSTVFGSKSTSDATTVSSELEKLFQNKFDRNVEVINGGIGGATSYNEIKLIENKLLSLKPDMLIVYDGVNDLRTRYNTLDISDEQYDLGAHILIKKMETFTYIPQAIIKIESKIRSDIGLALIGKTHAGFSSSADYTESVIISKSVDWSDRWNVYCENIYEQNIPMYIFLQPILGTGDKIYSDYENELINNEQETTVYQFYGHMEKQLHQIEYCRTYDISHTFDNVEIPIYFDMAHTSDTGNKIIAEKIYEKILPKVLEDISK